MIPIVRLAIPTPYPVGPVNAYLINTRPYTLIDPGPNSREAKESLCSGLADAGVRLEDIERVIITHSHADHAGLAAWVRGRSGAAVLAHPYEFAKLTGGSRFWRVIKPFLERGGVPPAALASMRAVEDPLPPEDLASGEISPLWGGERLPAGDDWLEVLHLPGHAVGHLGLFEPRQGDLLSGDFLLPDITPNPVLEPDPEREGERAHSLGQYLASLDRVAALGVRLVWPGHGNPFGDAHAVIESVKVHHAGRLEFIGSLVGGSWLTPYEITGLVYPDLVAFNIFLGFSEVAGHLDLLEEQGRLVRREEDGRVFYRHSGR